MMWTVLLIFVSCYLTKADHDARCGDDSKTGLTLEDSIDGVGGRYKVEWCTAWDRNFTAWELVMRYDDRPKEYCTNYYEIDPPGLIHSRFDEPLTHNLNCTNVCFTKYLDLMFNGTCYHIKTWFQGAMISESHDTLHYITNPYNKEYFTENQAYFSSISMDDEIVLELHSGYIPVTEYQLELYNENNTWYEDVTRNCSVSRWGARCAVRVPQDCYDAIFFHLAPWTASAELFNRTLSCQFCRSAADAPGVPATDAGDAARWAAGGGAAAALLALLLAAAWRARHAARRRQRVLWDWLARREPSFAPECKAAEAAAAAGAAEEAEGAAVVVLLYARDCAALLRVAARLRALLQDASGCQVVDLYSSAAVAAAAGGAASWLRALLRRPHARVLLLQTPAAAALHAPALRDRAPGQLPTLCAPLLGAGAAYRRPHAGDAAFALALRHVAETAHAHPQPYRKYYVAEIAGMPADVLRGVTPLRRYVLPDAAPALLRDLAAPAPPAPALVPPAPALRELAAAVDELRAFVRDRPHYLDDELIFM